MHKAFKLGLPATALMLAGAAQAGTALGSDLLGGAQSLGGGVTVSASGSAPLCTKFYFVDTTALGVSGGAAGCEIDLGESLTLSFSQAVHVSNLNLAFLYSGPEFDDHQEMGLLTATLADHSTVQAAIMAIGPTTAVVTDGDVTNVQPAMYYSAGSWSWDNPFLDAPVTSIKFETGPYQEGVGSQSDYALYSVSAAAVPEPGAMTLALAGIGAIGFLARRRRIG